MGNKQYAAQQLAERFVDQREIQNVMGKYMFTTMICKDADVAARFWSKKAPEPALGLNDGWYVGLDAIDGYYRAISVNTAVRSKAIQARFPEKLGSKTDEELYGTGTMNVRPLTTVLVEVAGDGQTAKGLWQVMGVDNDITEYGPLSTWRWGWAAADFVLEDGQWKVWHLQMLDEIVTPVGSKWTESAPYPVLPEFAHLADLTGPAPNRPCTLYTAYRADRPFQAPPEAPVPYQTFAETFSYGV